MPPSFPTRRSSDLQGRRLGERLDLGIDEHRQRHVLAAPGRARPVLEGIVLRGAVLQRRPAPGDEEHHQPQRHVRSEEHTSELQSLMRISYAVFCLKKKKTT